MDYFRNRRSPPQGVNPPIVRRQRRALSILRLVNLALGISATAAFVCFISPLPSLTTVLFKTWFSRSSLETVPPWILVATSIGVDLWFPASVLMILFALTGLPRKLEAPRPRFTGAVLTAIWVAYVILTIALSWLAEKFDGSEAAGAVGLIVGVPLILVLPLFIVAGLIASFAQLAALWRHSAPEVATRVSRSWLAWAVIPLVLLILPLLFAPSQPRALTVRGNEEFAALCRTTGVRLMAKPVGPVRSIAYDWDPERMERPSGLHTVDERGNFAVGGGSWSGPREVAKGRERLVFDFIESRQDDWCHARSDVRMPYAHCPSYRASMQLKAPYYAIDTFTADVLAYFEVDRLDFKNNRITHGPVRFQVTLSDRRSGAVLGEMAYVVDRANGRACGVNFGDRISYEAFIWDAIHQ
jgi:hypothetical protein